MRRGNRLIKYLQYVKLVICREECWYGNCSRRGKPESGKELNSMSHKSWLSPLLFVLFVALSISGLLMMFHLWAPGMKTIHQWGGIIFLIGGVFHLSLNWKLFTHYFKSKTAVISASAAAIVIIATMLISPQEGKDRSFGKGGGYQGYSGIHRNVGRR